MSLANEQRLAETRVLRTIIVVWGISTVAFFILNSGSIVLEAPHLLGRWNPIATVLVFLPPPLLALLSRYFGLVTLRALLRGYAITFAIVVVTFVPAMVGEPLPTSLAPWPLSVVGLGTVAAALAWRPILAWGYLLFHVIAMGLVRFYGGGQQNAEIALQDAFFSISFIAVFTALALVSLRNGRAVDEAAAAARVVAARASSASARVRERARLDALVHDEVMTTLFYATVGTPELDSAVARQARRALEQLRSRSGGEELALLGADEFVSRFRSATLAQSSLVRMDVAGERGGDVPIDVGSAFIEAAAEAVRNSLAHGGVTINIEPVQVRLKLGEQKIVATIVDRGVGFNLRAVPAHRLGIRVSIEGRLAIVPGCVATVESRPGHGTKVTLLWEAS